MAVAALASGTFVPAAHAAPRPPAFGAATAVPKAHGGACPASVTLSTTVQVQAPAKLKYVWAFSDGDETRAETYQVVGTGLKTVRLTASVRVTGDARGWGGVHLFQPAALNSRRASFTVDCAGGGAGKADAWDAVSTSAEEVATPPPGQGGEPVRNPVREFGIVFDRTDPSKCPVTFRVHGVFEGLPPGARTVQYRVVGTKQWKAVQVPADHGPVFTAVLETLTWDEQAGKSSVRVELKQPDGLRSNTLYYFECGPPPSKGTFGATAQKIALTTAGGPLAELVADAYLDAVRTVSGAQAALISRTGFRTGLNKGPVTYIELHETLSAGFAVDVRSMTGAALKKLLAHRNPSGWVLTPSASLRYTVTDGVVTEITLDGTPVTDTQVIKIAANYHLMGGWQGFPQWTESTRVYNGGPDERGALATYIVKNSPVKAPKGDRVTIR